MAHVLALLMAAVSFLMNRQMLKHIGPEVILTYGPLLEEVVKSLPAYYLGVNLMAVHFTFGMIEGLWDWVSNSRQCLWATIGSIVGHSLFGFLTTLGLYLTGSIWPGLASGLAAHWVWNVMVIRALSHRE
jgi:hypothetical protein